MLIISEMSGSSGCQCQVSHDENKPVLPLFLFITYVEGGVRQAAMPDLALSFGW